MGNTGSKLDKVLADTPETERYFGLENFGNTCYCNSVLQALYFCRPFREKVLSYAQALPDEPDDNLLNSLADLFQQISTSKKKTGVIPPKKFVTRLKRDNELFRSFMHQDAHEFLNYLLNQVCEVLEAQAKQKGLIVPGKPFHTWVHDIFQLKMVNQTKCLRCENVTNREEVFMDLPLEIQQNCSLTSCLRNFSATEMLDKDDKFFCDNCCSLQEAQKCMKLAQLPQILICHLKRFKYMGEQNRMRKLMYRVVFPMELKLSNTTDDCACADQLYTLFAVVVHVGSGPHHGHYVALIKSHSNWLFFDDESVESIPESMVQAVFGATPEYSNNMDHGYLLFYERASGAERLSTPSSSKHLRVQSVLGCTPSSSTDLNSW